MQRQNPQPFKFKDKTACNLFAVVLNCILNSLFRALFRRYFKYRHISACIYLARMDAQCEEKLPTLEPT